MKIPYLTLLASLFLCFGAPGCNRSQVELTDLADNTMTVLTDHQTVLGEVTFKEDSRFSLDRTTVVQLGGRSNSAVTETFIGQYKVVGDSVFLNAQIRASVSAFDRWGSSIDLQEMELPDELSGVGFHVCGLIHGDGIVATSVQQYR